ncbi:MAG TPA: cytochrome c oxidase subunit 3 [Myxococcales bacterium]|nr:cytochrome c oxidase subunit 3 [Myxococcales bacterium]
MGDVVRYRPPRPREETTAAMGMVLFLGSWAMLFAALFLAYGFARMRLTSWPPAGVAALPWKLPLGNTLVLGLSSWSYQRAVREVQMARAARAWPWVAVAMALGITFVGLQVVLWRSVGRSMEPGAAGAYSSVFYGLTWLHAAHAAVGILGLGYVLARAVAGAYSGARHLSLRLWGMYWHFVGAVWALMFVTIFVL